MDEQQITPVRPQSDFSKIKTGTLDVSKTIKELIKNHRITASYENVIALDMSLDIAKKLRITPTEAFAFLMTLGDVIQERLFAGKTAVVPGTLNIYAAKSTQHQHRVIARSKPMSKLKKLMTRCVVADIHNVRTESHKSKERKTILNRLVEEKSLDALLFFIFGHPEYNIDANPSAVPSFLRASARSRHLSRKA